MGVMMAYMGLHESLKIEMWFECAVTTTKLENIMVNPHKYIRAYDKVYGKMTDYAK